MQKLALIQPRTSPVKFARSPCIIITDLPGHVGEGDVRGLGRPEAVRDRDRDGLPGRGGDGAGPGRSRESEPLSRKRAR